MSARKAGVSLRSLALTPERIPQFLIPSSASRSPLLFLSPRTRRDSPDRTRLLSEESAGTSPENPRSPTLVSPRLLRLKIPVPAVRIGRHRHNATDDLKVVDTDLSTRAAMSLPHVEKVTTPYGFRAVLAASPCLRRRESMFHQKKTVTFKVPDTDATDGSDPNDRGLGDPVDPAAAQPPGASRMCLGPVKALGLQMVKELKKPVAALKALSPARRRAEPAET